MRLCPIFFENLKYSLNYIIIVMLSVLCLYLVNICLIFLILYMLCRSLIAGQGPGSGQSRGRSRKHGLSPRTHCPATTPTAPVSTTPTTAATSASLGHSPHTQEFVMIPNPGYVELWPQPSFSLQPFLPPPLRGEAHTSHVPSFAPSSTPSQLGSQDAQASSSTPSQGSMNQRVELRYDSKS